MKAVVLDMYGVIVTQTGDDLVSTMRTNYKLAIISNDSSRWSQYLREKFDLNQYFDVISISGDLKIKKPDEEIFRQSIEQLGCSASDCIYVDDRIGNIVAANKIGMKTVLFNSMNIPYDGDAITNFKELGHMLIKLEIGEEYSYSFVKNQ